MDLTKDAVVIVVEDSSCGDMHERMNFPMLDVPTVAIDFDDTLAVYDGEWKGADVLGPPRENAVWALACFKHNNFDVMVFTNRNVNSAIWAWAEENIGEQYGVKGLLVDRINETRPRKVLDEEPGRDSPKPAVDIFIEDRSWNTWGEELVWLEVMETLEGKGLFPNGLLPRGDPGVV